MESLVCHPDGRAEPCSLPCERTEFHSLVWMTQLIPLWRHRVRLPTSGARAANLRPPAASLLPRLENQF